MTQATPTIGAGQSGLAYRNADNDGKKALLNHHKGASAPSYAEAGIIWIDDTATPWLLKIYDGADWIVLGEVDAASNAFIVLGEVDAASNAFNPYIGTASSRVLNDAADTGAANAYAVAPVPAIAAYATGQAVLLRPAHASTGAATLAVSGLAAKNIKLPDGANPASGALVTTGVYLLVYDGTNFVLLNAAATTVPVTQGGTGVTSTTAYAVLCGGTTGTGPLQSIAGVGTSGQVLTSNGAGAKPTFQTPAAAGVATVQKQIFTGSGTYTPTAGMLYCIIEMVGGGGGGGGTNGNNAFAGGGGAGSYARSVVTAAAIGASKSVTVGAAGTAGANTGGNGGTGGASSVGTIITTNGGAGGTGDTTGTAAAHTSTGGAGGAAGTADVGIVGGAGANGEQVAAGTGWVNMQGSGADSMMGSGSVLVISGGAAPAAVLGVAATGYGAGGGGARGTSKAGGAGTIGLVVITEFCA